ncbi:hypothetical protein GOODEAATRI_032918, partial [Goodea atripinnis]
MASEALLEDLVGDQLTDLPVPADHSDAESSVGNCGQSRALTLPPSLRLLTIHSYGRLFCQLPRSLPVKTSALRLQIICDISCFCAG